MPLIFVAHREPQTGNGRNRNPIVVTARRRDYMPKGGEVQIRKLFVQRYCRGLEHPGQTFLIEEDGQGYEAIERVMEEQLREQIAVELTSFCERLSRKGIVHPRKELQKILAAV